MKHRALARAVLIGAPLALLASGAATGELIVYPKAGQSVERLNKDKYECSQWATEQTGFDPMNPPAPPELDTGQVTQGGAVKGAARGAAGGAAIGAIAGDAGKGAAIGAAAGGMRGNRRRRGAEQQQAQSNQASVEEYRAMIAASREKHEKAQKACLEARDYSVN